MKSSTQMLSLLLHPLQEKQRFAMDDSARSLMQSVLDLSPAGWRSLLHYLENQRTLELVEAPTGRQLNLTQRGVAACETEFPALNPLWSAWPRTWLMVVFTQAPVSDRQFRFLRSWLLDLGAMPLSRGNYMVPSACAQPLEKAILAGYEQHVVVFELASWQYLSEQRSVSRFYNLSDLAVGYSGISTELQGLLRIFHQNNTRSDQLKQRFSTAFRRFWELLGEDPGFVSHYIPSAPSAPAVLRELHQVFDLLFS